MMKPCDELVHVSSESRLLLLERLIGKGVCEDTTHPRVAGVISVDDAGSPLWILMVEARFLGEFERFAGDCVSVDVFPSFPVRVAEFVGSHSHDVAIVIVKLLGVECLVAIDKSEEHGYPAYLVQERSRIVAKRVKVDVVDAYEELVRKQLRTSVKKGDVFATLTIAVVAEKTLPMLMSWSSPKRGCRSAS